MRAGAWLLAALVIPTAAAFPPAPYYTIYGIVRDQVGATLEVQGAQIVLLRDGNELGRAPVLAELRGDLNYELNIRIDQSQQATRTYSHLSVPAGGLFSIAVEMNGQRYFPIEVSGNLRAGAGGERIRLDLNLGIDSDGDGLPDAWEQWQLHQAGIRPNPNWDLSLIDRDGDFDGDGVSNYHEYVAGTFAGDATERFELKITGRTAALVTFEFFAIIGKVYSIEESPDLKTWSTVAFTVGTATTAAHQYRAPTVNILPAQVAVPEGVSRFYRLSVR